MSFPFGMSEFLDEKKVKYFPYENIMTWFIMFK